MSNSYGKVYSPYDNLPSDVEPSTEDNVANSIANTFAESYAGHGLDTVEHVDRLREIMGEDVDTDISDITDVDSRIDHEDDDSVYAGLHEKLNLVINSDRLIIDRLDGIDDRMAIIEACVDVSKARDVLDKAVAEEIEKKKNSIGDM